MSGITVGFAGMTHLAVNSLAAMAARGFGVVGFDGDADRVAALARCELPFSEPGLTEYLEKFHGRIRFTSDPSAFAACDVIHVAPDVPTDDGGHGDLAPVRDLVRVADTAMRKDAALVVLSQVPPGFTRSLALSRSTVYYQVETLIFGRAIARAMHPERYIVGCEDPTRPIAPAYRTVLAAGDCPILPMRYESAELCKIAINMFLAASVTATNVIAELCEKIGAEWAEIAPALRLDARIGPHAYLQPGLGISGGNLERDLATFLRYSDERGTDSRLLQAWVANSAYRKNWPLRMLHRHVISRVSGPVIGLLGLTYKEHTSSLKNSPALQLIRSLPSIPVRAYDPAAPGGEESHANLSRVASALDAADGVHALAIMTPWPEFRELDVSAIAARMAGNVVLDPYHTLDPIACAAAGLNRIALGSKAREEI